MYPETIRAKPMPYWVRAAARLIDGATDEIVIIGGNLSWSDQLNDSIRAATDQGREVRIYFAPKAKGTAAQKLQQRVQKLTDAGAEVYPLPIKTGLRIVLVDPDSGGLSRMLVIAKTVDRALKDDVLETTGVLGEEDLEYNGFLAKPDRYAVLFQAVIGLHDCFQKLSNSPGASSSG